jgi:hypothetical protein
MPAIQESGLELPERGEDVQLDRPSWNRGNLRVRSTGERERRASADPGEQPEETPLGGNLATSGPFVVPGVTVGDGLTILRADTETEARALMDDEPLIRLGLRSYELHLWEAREGRVSVELDISTGRVALP